MNKSFGEFGWVWILLAAVMWAGDGFLRRSLYVLPSEVIVFCEHVIGSLILLPFVYKQMLSQKMTRFDFKWLFLVSLFSGLLGTLWFTQALAKVNFISVSVVYLIQKLQPIFAILSARIILKEKLHSHFWIWATLALIFGYFITFPLGKVNWDTGSGTAWAGVLALGAAVAWGSSTAVSKKLLVDRSYEWVLGWRFLLTTFLSGLLVVFSQKSSSLFNLQLNHIYYFVMIAVSTGMLATLFYYRGLKSTKVQVTTILELVFPALVVLVDGYINEQWLHPSQYLSAVVLLAIMYKIVRLN